jgi:hypothetical protein
MHGATERWVELPEPVYQNCKEVCCQIFPNQREFCKWASDQTTLHWEIHSTCEMVEGLVFGKTQQRVKLYRIHRMSYVGFLIPNEIRS